jgi:hypothetical protein
MFFHQRNKTVFLLFQTRIEPTILVLEQLKTLRTLNRIATVIRAIVCKYSSLI